MALVIASGCGPGWMPDVVVGVEAREVQAASWGASEVRVVRGWERRVSVGLGWSGEIGVREDADGSAPTARRSHDEGFPCAIEAACVWERSARARSLLALREERRDGWRGD